MLGKREAELYAHKCYPKKTTWAFIIAVLAAAPRAFSSENTTKHCFEDRLNQSTRPARPMYRPNDPISNWIKYGVDLERPDPYPTDYTGTPTQGSLDRFLAECDAAGVALIFNKRDFKGRPPYFAIHVVRDINNDLQAAGPKFFELKYGFAPTQETFLALMKVARSFGRFEHSYTAFFRPYEKLRVPAELTKGRPRKFIDAAEGVADFWNTPDDVLARMNDIRALAEATMQSDPGLSEKRALEKIRKKMLVEEHGFKQEEEVLYEILTTQKWHEVLRSGKLTRDPGVSHSFSRTGNDGQYSHANQWLLLVLDMKKNPERYGTFAKEKAVDFYKALGNSETDLPQSSTFSRANLWYFLFDNVGFPNAGENPSFSNPIYFNEVWHHETGFDRSH